ncbi:ATPase, T2SS/T4P/T4SS family [Glaciimonas sp. GG7]
MNQLSDLVFSNIYLGQHKILLGGVPGKLDPTSAPQGCTDELQALRTKCEVVTAATGREDFNVTHNGVIYRAAILLALNEIVYVLRRFPDATPPLESLGIHKSYVERLMSAKMTGLVVISGSFNQGKTTTASATVKCRIARYGGVAVTVEDPPEMPLEGRHGEGVIYQTDVTQGGFGQACRKAARWAPSIIFLGEIRDAESAAEALRASINGCLVICTAHADNIATTIERLYALASAQAGNTDDVASLLANGITAVLHQKLEADGAGIKRPKVSFLWMPQGAESAAIRTTIRKRSFNQIENEVQLQLNQTLMQKERTT